MEKRNLSWFCVRSQPKHEHLAAAHLRKMEAVAVFLPRIRFKRAVSQGMAWVTEALFPGYLFARFDWQLSLRRVQTASGVQGVVHFGNHWPVISEEVIEGLRQIVGVDELHTLSTTFSPGDSVQITDGTLRGLNAIVSHIVPGKERVAVLMELLGRQTTVDLSTRAVIKAGNERAALFSSP